MEDEIKELVEIAKKNLELQEKMLKLVKESNLITRQMNVYLDKLPS